MASISQEELLNQSTAFGTSQIGTIEEDQIEPDPASHDYTDVVGAALTQESSIFSFAAKQSLAPDVPLVPSMRAINPDYNPYSEDLTGYELFADRFQHLNSPEEVHQTKKLIDLQLKSKKILQESGFAGAAASMGASLIDPTLAIPAAGAIINTTKASTAALKGAVKLGGVTAGAVATQEALLQATQTERSIEESVINTIGASMVGGIMGGALGFMGVKATSRAQAEMTQIIENAEVSYKIKPDQGVELDLDSFGAAKTQNVEGLAHLNETLAKVMSGPEFLRPTSLRALTSPFEGIQQWGDAFYEHSYTLNKHLQGYTSGTAVETSVTTNMNKLAGSFSKVEGLYKSYAQTKTNVGAAFKGVISSDTMTARRFYEEIAKSLRRGDVHEIPQVQKAAKLLRAEFDRISQRLIRAGFLDESVDVGTASTYFSRKYDTNKLVTPEGSKKFKAILTRHFSKNLSGDELKLAVDKTYKNIIGLNEDFIETDNLAGHLLSAKPNAKIAKHRTLDIPDTELEEFLINDPLSVMGTYAAQAEKMLSIKDMLDRLGVDSIADLKAKFNADFDNLVAKQPQNRAKLTKQFKKDLTLFEKQMEFFLKGANRGTVLPTLRALQTVSKLGGVLISSVPDMASSVLEHGLKAVIKDGYLPMFRSIKAAKMSSEELSDMGAAVLSENDIVLKMLTDPDADYSKVATGLTKGMELVLHGFGKMTGLTYWNNFHKRIGAKVSLARTMRTLDSWAKTGKIDAKEATRLNRLGIGQEHWKDLVSQMKQAGGGPIDGSYILNLPNWEKTPALSALENSITRDSNMAGILVPTRGDLPLIVQESEIAKTMFQFKSFASAATGKITLKALDRRDAAALQGVIMMIGLGGAVHYIKDLQAGKDPEITPQYIIGNGIVRSGLLGLMGDYTLGAASAMFGGVNTRYAGQNLWGIVAGPGASASLDYADVLTKVLNPDHELTDSDKRKIVRMLPYQNLFWLRAMLDKLNQ